MFEKIVVSLDGSRNAELVLPYVQEIAGKFGSEIILIGVTEGGGAREEVNQLYLAHIAGRVFDQGKDFGIIQANKIKYQLLTGAIANNILRYADESGASIIAMTSKGTSIKSPWELGNISAKVLRASNLPVLLVRRKTAEKVVYDKNLIRKILLPLDGSKLGEAAIPYAETLAAALKAKIVLIKIIEPLDKTRIYDSSVAEAVTDNIESVRKNALEYFDKLAEEIKTRNVIEVTEEVLIGYPARQILDYALQNEVDLIAMSTHGRSGIDRWVFGSVTDKILHSGDTSVLVVRPKK
jgi:nucleotide-binding universal stress UspA family protein